MMTIIKTLFLICFLTLTAGNIFADEVCGPKGCYADCQDHCAAILARTQYSQADTDSYESCLTGCSIMENSFTSSSGEVDCDRANEEMSEQCGKQAPGNDGPCFAILEKWVGITGCM